MEIAVKEMADAGRKEDESGDTSFRSYRKNEARSE
jgi:hypothetical protein